jgi:hypothetical protein
MNEYKSAIENFLPIGITVVAVPRIFGNRKIQEGWNRWDRTGSWEETLVYGVVAPTGIDRSRRFVTDRGVMLTQKSSQKRL